MSTVKSGCEKFCVIIVMHSKLDIEIIDGRDDNQQQIR